MTKQSRLQKKVIDSINSIKQKIGIASRTVIYDDAVLLDFDKLINDLNFAKFETIFNRLKNETVGKNIKIDLLKQQTIHELEYLENLPVESDRIKYSAVDWKLTFSNISMDIASKKAVLIYSLSSSKLSGATIVCFLEKIKGNWEIVYQKTISIS